MPGLDTLMQMLYSRQQEASDAPNKLAQALAGIVKQKNQADFKQNAIKWFSDGEVTADKIQKFQQYYPNIDPQETLKIAGDVATLKTAQSMKDAGNSFMSFLKNTDPKSMTYDKIQEFAKTQNMNPEQERIFFTQMAPKALEIYKQNKPERYTLGAGGKRMEENQSIGGQDIVVADNPVVEKTPVLEQAITDKMKQINPDTQKAFTASEAYTAIVHPPKEPVSKLLTPEEEAQQIRIAKEKRPAPNPKEEKGPTSSDLSQLRNMIVTATDSGKQDPNTTDLAIIKKAAAAAGYDFVNTKGTKPGLLYGTNPTSTWGLVEKETAPVSGVTAATPKISEPSLRADLIKHGHTAQSADEYIRKAKAAGKF
jgi:hypothetical protein